MSRCLPKHTFIWVLQLRPVLCLYVPSFQGGCSGFGLVLFSLCTGMALATFDGWLNTKTLGCILRGSRETVSLPFLLCNRVETDSGRQTDDLLDLNTLNLTIPCWQPVEKCWVVIGRVLGNESRATSQASSHSALPLFLRRSSVKPRLMRVYWGLCVCLLSQNRALSAKQ